MKTMTRPVRMLLPLISVSLLASPFVVSSPAFAAAKDDIHLFASNAQTETVAKQRNANATTARKILAATALTMTGKSGSKCKISSVDESKLLQYDFAKSNYTTYKDKRPSFTDVYNASGLVANNGKRFAIPPADIAGNSNNDPYVSFKYAHSTMVGKYVTNYNKNAGEEGGLSEIKMYNRANMFAECGAFVQLSVWTSGIDPEYPAGNLPAQQKYMFASNKWTCLGTVNRSTGNTTITKTITDENGNTTSTKGGTLQPGDILVAVNGLDTNTKGGHIAVYVGSEVGKTRYKDTTCAVAESGINEYWPSFLPFKTTDTRYYRVYRCTNPNYDGIDQLSWLLPKGKSKVL